MFPVINGSAFYIDDFPSRPCSRGRHLYQTGLWDVHLGLLHQCVVAGYAGSFPKTGMRYTGLIIENYENRTSGDCREQGYLQVPVLWQYVVVDKGGELGFHGYNHQPLCQLENFVYQPDLGYHKWESYEEMEDSVEEADRVLEGHFPGNILPSMCRPQRALPEGRKMLGEDFPRSVHSQYVLSGESAYEPGV